jgi:hypothetical protein
VNTISTNAHDSQNSVATPRASVFTPIAGLNSIVTTGVCGGDGSTCIAAIILSCSVFVTGDFSASAAIGSSGALLQLQAASRKVPSAAALHVVDVEVLVDGWEPGGQRRLAGHVELGVELLHGGPPATAGLPPSSAIILNAPQSTIARMGADELPSTESTVELEAAGRLLAGSDVVDVLVRLSRGAPELLGLELVANEVHSLPFLP